MPAYKQNSKYKPKRKKVFAGRIKQEIQDGGKTSKTNTDPLQLMSQSPQKKQVNQRKN